MKKLLLILLCVPLLFSCGNSQETEITHTMLDNGYTGQGTLIYPEGSKYVGLWKEGKKHGQGTFNLANGDKYEGEYKEGKHYGQGTFAWANGDKYVGEWKGNKRNGQETYPLADGTIYHKCIWENGKPVK